MLWNLLNYFLFSITGILATYRHDESRNLPWKSNNVRKQTISVTGKSGAGKRGGLNLRVVYKYITGDSSENCSASTKSSVTG